MDLVFATVDGLCFDRPDCTHCFGTDVHDRHEMTYGKLTKL